MSTTSEKPSTQADNTDPTNPPLPPPPSSSSNKNNNNNNNTLPAWTQILSSHLCVFSTFGLINSFGIFQTHYTTTAPFPTHPTASTISWIGSLQILLIYGLGTFSGRLHDAGHLRATLIAGHALLLLGIFALSFASTYWQALLAQGVCQGVGMGLIFCPAVANAASYFGAGRRVLAVSGVACGGATGGMVFPAVAQTLLPRVGFGWTVRVMGFVVLFNAGVVVALARTRVLVLPGGERKKKKAAPVVEWRAFGEAPYALYCVSMFFAFWGIWIAYYYVSVAAGSFCFLAVGRC